MTEKELVEKVTALGYPNTYAWYLGKPKQELWIYRDKKLTKPVAKLSLKIPCRISSEFSGVNKKDKELLKLIYEFSVNLGGK